MQRKSVSPRKKPCCLTCSSINTRSASFAAVVAAAAAFLARLIPPRLSPFVSCPGLETFFSHHFWPVPCSLPQVALCLAILLPFSLPTLPASVSGQDWRDCVIQHALIPHLHLAILPQVFFFFASHLPFFTSTSRFSRPRSSLSLSALPVSALPRPSLLTSGSRHKPRRRPNCTCLLPAGFPSPLFTFPPLLRELFSYDISSAIFKQIYPRRPTLWFNLSYPSPPSRSLAPRAAASHYSPEPKYCRRQKRPGIFTSYVLIRGP